MRQSNFSVFQAWTKAEDEVRAVEREMALLARTGDPDGRMLTLLGPLREKRAAASRALRVLLRSTVDYAAPPGEDGSRVS